MPPGEYWFPGASFRYESARSSALRFSTELNAGHFFDGTRVALSVSPTVAVSKHLEVEARWETNVIKFANRGEEFTFHLLGAKLQFALNKKLSADLFLQYNTAADFATTNVRFRYNFGEGSDLWLVVTEGTNRDRERQLPVLPVSSSRTGVLKYTYTFRR